MMSSLGTISGPDEAVRIPFLQSLVLARVEVRQAILLVSGVWLFIASVSVWRCTWDDSYIIFRYAQNLANGLGLVFNPGQRVEGFTSFLWVLLVAGGTRITSDPILVSKVLGLLINLSSLVAVYLLCRMMATEKIPIYGFALVLTASNSHFIVGGISGLETPLFTSILCWSMVAYLRAIRATQPRRQAGWCIGASLLLALLVLTRPDGALTFLLLWCHALWKFRRQVSNVVFFTLPLVLLYGPYFLWRWHYFGFFLPNTFYVKRGGTLGLLAKGAAQTGKFLGYQAGGWLASGIAGVAAILFPTIETTVLGLAIISRVAFVLWSGGITPGEFRFLVPALPLIWILIEHALVRGLGAFGARRRAYVLLAGTCGLLLVGQLAAFCQFRAQSVKPVEISMEQAHIGLGKWLDLHSPPSAKIAVGDIGGIGFWSHREILDLDGLTDTHISHLPGVYSQKRDSRYVLQQTPDFIVLRTSSCRPGITDISFAMDQAVYADPQFRSHYGQLSCWEFWPRYDLLLYQRGAAWETLEKSAAEPQRNP
jgi:arabinofuranosyltransferase